MTLVSKASDYSYYDFEIETNIFTLFEKYGAIVLNLNKYFDEDPREVSRFYEISLEIAEKIVKCKYEIIIYDDYIE